MKKVSEKRLDEFIATAHCAAAYGLVHCSSGNLSWRIDNDYMLITTTDS